MIAPDYFRDQQSLTTSNLRLEPLGPQHFDGSWATLNDAESRRLAGIRDERSEDEHRSWLASLPNAHDRADWAILRADDGAFVGEVVLSEFDPYNESMNLRITLSGSGVFGKGYGSEATKAVVDYGLQFVRLHRISLRVVDFNTRAQRVYAKVGFHPEGLLRDAWYWDGEWSDVVVMAIVAGH